MIKLRARERWSERKSEFPSEFNIKLVHKDSLVHQIIFNLCFRPVLNVLLPRENRVTLSRKTVNN